MPPLLRHLSRASFLSAQVMLPSQEERDRHKVDIEVQSHKTNLCSHYNRYQASSQYLRAPRQHQGAVGRVELWSYATVPAERDVGPKHVDEFHSRCAAGACASLGRSVCLGMLDIGPSFMILLAGKMSSIVMLHFTCVIDDDTTTLTFGHDRHIVVFLFAHTVQLRCICMSSTGVTRMRLRENLR